VHAGQHAVSVVPSTQGKQGSRFTQAVADGSLRLNAEAPHQVADGTANGNLAEDDGSVVVVDFRQGRSVPEPFRLKLTAQIEVAFILAAEYLRPAAGKFHAHAGVMIS